MKADKIFCIVALWSMVVMSMSAQSSSSTVEFGKKTLKRAQNVADKLSRGHFDSTYVSLPEYKWMVTMSGNANYCKFRMKVTIPDIAEDEEMRNLLEDMPSFFLDPAVYTYDMNLHTGSQSEDYAELYGSNISDLEHRQAFCFGRICFLYVQQL